MRFGKKTVQPTLFLNGVGVLVETLEHHAFAPGGQKPRADMQEVNPPQGAAVVAVQFTHAVGERFLGLQCFKLGYYHRAPGQDLMEEYLAVPYDSLKWAATPVEPQSLTADQRRVLQQLLGGSDPKAWEASPDFRADLEGTKR
ncbi:MAG: hypothetical protein H0X37_09130 [Herpetosiphonaceae bacterium]|nr:hypothetical protein [Herpetosiphonaceae bacterium]